jgi:hypothetical protein
MLQIANTQFEEELSQEKLISLHESFYAHPVFLQLHYLPFLYASSQDVVVVTMPPPQEFLDGLKQLGIAPPQFLLFSDQKIEKNEIESWGFSRSVAAWANEKGLDYTMPEWEYVKRVNSKLFSFSCSPLPGARLLDSEEKVHDWIKEQPGPKVLKSCFGFAGRGHFLIQESYDPEKLRKFLQPEFAAKRTLIAEPWKERVLDFSTQWKIDSQIHYLGATLCESDARGVHKQNSVGDEEDLFGDSLPFLHQQKTAVLSILKQMQEQGYFGNVGIDSMLYRENGKINLQPVVEINARKTMGWVALEVQRRHFPGKKLSLQFLPRPQANMNLLPSSLTFPQGKTQDFPRTLCLIF